MYTNEVQYCNCQSQDSFSTLNITLSNVDFQIALLAYVFPSFAEFIRLFDFYLSYFFFFSRVNGGVAYTQQHHIDVS